MLAILSALIIVHECGHFSVARLFGFQTPVFGFGLPFGPSWTLGKKWGTEFKVHACLLGGYVAIPELGDESNAEAFGMQLQPFRKFPIWQRALVAFAGVGFNILFAYLIMLVMIVTLGQPVQPTRVQELDQTVPIAAQAGIKAGDELKSVDGTEIISTDTIIKYLRAHKLQTVHLTVMRDDKPVTVDLTPNKDGRVGMMLVPGSVSYRKVSGGPLFIAKTSAVQLWTTTASMVENLGEMVHGLFSRAKATPGHPKLGIQDLHGVLAIIKIGADISKTDWTQLLMFTVLISMDLAIVNLFPWPALDGWHLATMTLEAIRGKPMGERVQGEFVKWGFVSLIVLMAVIMVNDVTALMTGKLDFKGGKDKSAKTHDAVGNNDTNKNTGADSKPDAAVNSQPESGGTVNSKDDSSVTERSPVK